MSDGSLEWIFWALLPLLTVGVLYWVLSSFGQVPDETETEEENHRYNTDYLSWCEWIKAKGGPKPLLRTRLFGKSEPCFALEHDVALYDPKTLCIQCGSVEEPLFVTPSGTPVGENWSIGERFEGAHFVSRGTLYVTARELHFRGARANVKVPLRMIHTVMAACSGILLGVEPPDRSCLFVGINGQKLRDVIAFLLEG